MTAELCVCLCLEGGKQFVLPFLVWAGALCENACLSGIFHVQELAKVTLSMCFPSGVLGI